MRSLREAIYNRQLPSGARLIDSELAGQLDVSRGTVRNALRALTYEGLVESQPHRGYFVAETQPEQVIELLELRAALESRAAAASVQRLTEEDLARLSEIADEIGATCYYTEIEDVRRLDIEFHTVVTRRCNKPLLLELWASLNSRLCMLDILCADILKITAEESARRHHEYIDALRSRLREQAHKAATEHYQYHIRRYRQYLSEQGIDSSVGSDEMTC